MILGLCLDRENIISLIVDLREEFLLLFRCIEILRHELQRRCDDDLVKFLDLAVDGHIDLSVLTLNRSDVAVESRLMCKVLVELFPDVLCSFLPGPQIDFDEVHGRLEVKILQNVRCRDLIKISVTE